MTRDFHQAYVRLRSQPTGEWLVHPSLRDRLVEDAQAAGTSITEVACQILAERFKVRYTPPGRRTRPPRAQADILNMGIPLNIWNAIIGAKRKFPGRSEMDLVRAALCDHYGLPHPA